MCETPRKVTVEIHDRRWREFAEPQSLLRQRWKGIHVLLETNGAWVRTHVASSGCVGRPLWMGN